MKKKPQSIFFPQASHSVRWADGAARKMCGEEREKRRERIAKRNVVAIFASFVLGIYYTSYGNNVSVYPTSNPVKWLAKRVCRPCAYHDLRLLLRVIVVLLQKYPYDIVDSSSSRFSTVVFTGCCHHVRLTEGLQRWWHIRIPAKKKENENG